MKNIMLLFVICGIIGILGCNKEPFKKTVKNEKMQAEARSGMTVRQAFASTLLTSIQNVSALQIFIYNKIQKADTSVYELIYIAVKDEVIVNGNTFADIMNNYASSQVVAEYGSNFFNTITDAQPLLTISMSDFNGMEVSNWQASTIPDVFAVSATNNNQLSKYSINQGSPQYFTVDQNTNPATVVTRYSLVIKKAEGYYLFNSSGQSFSSIDIGEYLPSTGDASKDATDKGNLINAINTGNYNQYTINGTSYFLIGHNELLKEFVSVLGPNPYYNPYFPDIEGYIVACPDCPGPPPPPPPPPDCVSECERDCEDLEEYMIAWRIHSNINTWDVFENFDNQFWERKYVFHAKFMLASVINGQLSPIVRTYVSAELSKDQLLDCSPHPCGGRWIMDKYRIWPKDWDKSELGTPYTVHWYEVDNRKTTSTVSISQSAGFTYEGVNLQRGVTFSYQVVGSTTVDLGDQSVGYCDDILRANYTGSIQFKCN